MTFSANDISIVIFENPLHVQYFHVFGNDGVPFDYSVQFTYIDSQHMCGHSITHVAPFTFLRFFLQGLMSCGVNVRDTKPFLEAIAPE